MLLVAAIVMPSAAMAEWWGPFPSSSGLQQVVCLGDGNPDGQISCHQAGGATCVVDGTAHATCEGERLGRVECNRVGLDTACVAASGTTTCQEHMWYEESGAACWEAGPALLASSDLLTFPDIAVGDRSSAETVQLDVIPAGSRPLTVTRVTASGDFVVVAENCTGAGALSLCIVQVAFAPTAAGLRTGQLTVETDAATGSRQIALEGTGAATPTRRFQFASGDVLNAGSAPVGQTTEAMFLFLNSGNSTGRVSFAAISGEFAIVDDECSAGAIPPYGGCWVTVRFMPSGEGTRVGSMTASGDFENLPAAWTIQGEGVPIVASLSASTAVLDFGAVFGGTLVRHLSLFNDGNAPVTVARMTLSPPGGAFVLGSTADCVRTLAPGETCDLRLDFAPVDYGFASGSLVVDSTADRSPLTVALRGRLVHAATTVSASASRLAVGRAPVGGGSAGKGVTLTNTGSNLLYVERPAAGEPYEVALGSCAAPVDPGGQCTLTLHARPAGGGVFATEARIPVNTSGLYVPVTLVGFGDPRTCP